MWMLLSENASKNRFVSNKRTGISCPTSLYRANANPCGGQFQELIKYNVHFDKCVIRIENHSFICFDFKTNAVMR